MKLTLYTTHCPMCVVVEKLLKERNLDFDIVDLSRPSAQSIEAMALIESQGIRTMPVLEVANENGKDEKPELLTAAKIFAWIKQFDSNQSAPRKEEV